MPCNIQILPIGGWEIFQLNFKVNSAGKRDRLLFCFPRTTYNPNRCSNATINVSRTYIHLSELSVGTSFNTNKFGTLLQKYRNGNQLVS